MADQKGPDTVMASRAAPPDDIDDAPAPREAVEKLVLTVHLSSAMADAFRTRSVRRYGQLRGAGKLARRYILLGMKRDDEEERAGGTNGNGGERGA
jgi:hypothetical protein